MLSVNGAWWSTAGSGPRRDSLAQSPARNIVLSLPSCSSARCVAASEPRASPSGFSCVVTRKRSRARIASATAWRSAWVVVCCVIRGVSVVGRRELVDQLRHTHTLLDRRIVFEREQRSPLEMKLTGHARLQHAVRRRQRRQAPLALALAAEHADVDARVAQVW